MSYDTPFVWCSINDFRSLVAGGGQFYSFPYSEETKLEYVAVFLELAT